MCIGTIQRVQPSRRRLNFWVDNGFSRNVLIVCIIWLDEKKKDPHKLYDNDDDIDEYK